MDLKLCPYHKIYRPGCNTAAIMAREIQIGKASIGGKGPILVQSMCNTKTADIRATVDQIHRLEEAGCEIQRVAVPDMASAAALKEIRDNISTPLVGDIHFDHRLAIEAARYCDKLRINPGNIGSPEKVREVIRAAKEHSIPLRIGVNMGSLKRDIEGRLGRTPLALVESALEHIRFFESIDFQEIVVSLKASDVLTTIKANILFRQKSDYPLHIGITEAGTAWEGTIKSSAGIGALLSQGIGETIRVSLTDDPIQEVRVGHAILRSLGLREGRVFISCPTCARTHGNLIDIAKEVEERTRPIDRPITIAVMGCEVNGPGEARHADYGIALGTDKAIIFGSGRIMKQVSKDEAVEALMAIMEADDVRHSRK
jgi:(E)-4-hydroxy-3-methylbut-2-enyl-diphosphate synthase